MTSLFQAASIASDMEICYPAQVSRLSFLLKIAERKNLQKLFEDSNLLLQNQNNPKMKRPAMAIIVAQGFIYDAEQL